MKANRQQREVDLPDSGATIAKVSDDEIRVRAYQIYLERNGEPGDPVEDWLQAETELRTPKLTMSQVA